MIVKKLKLPDISIKENLGIKLVKKSISLTVLLLISITLIAAVVVNWITIDLTIEGNGFLKPAKIFRIHSSETGILKDVYVQTGATVNKGDLLAVFDTLSVTNQIDKNKLKKEELLLSKKELLENLPYEKKRIQNILKDAESSVLEADLLIREKLIEFYPGKKGDSILADYKIGNHISIDKAYIKKLKSDIALKNAQLEAEKNILKKFDIEKIDLKIKDLNNEIKYLETVQKNNKVYAGSNGIILTEEIDEMIGRTFNKGSLLFEISEIKNWNIDLQIPEMEIHNIAIGDSVKIEITALNLSNDKKLYGGTVSYVAMGKLNSDSEQIQQNSYKVTATLNKSDFGDEEFKKLRRGFTAKASIITESDTIMKLLIKHFKDLL